MQTATNPQTGEKLVLQGGQWVPMSGGQAPAAPQAAPMVVGTPRPEKPEIRTVGNTLGMVDPATGGFTPTYTAPDKDKDKGDPLLTAAIKDLGLEELLLGVASARNEIDEGWATGIPGAVMRQFPGTNAADFKGTLTSLQGGIILEKMQALKEASKTGASGMGALSEKEGERLAAAVAALDTNLSPEKLAESLNQVERHARTLQAIAAGRDPRDPAVAKEFGIPPLAVDIDPNKPLSNEEIRAQLERRLAAGEDPAKTILWLQQNGQPLTEDTISAILANRGNQNPQISHKSDAQRSLESGIGGIAEGAGDLLGLVGNPLNAGINAIAGTDLSTDLGQTFRNATGFTDRGDPLADAITQGGTAALGGAGLARGVAQAIPATARFMAPLTAEPIRQGVAGAGAGAGTEIARQNNLGPVGQAAAGLAGGVGGYVGANSLMRFAQPKTVSPVMQAAQDLNIRLRPADVGGATTRRLDSAAAQSAFSANSIGKAAKRTQGDMGAALNRSARSQGDVLPPDEAGESLVGPLKGYSQKQAQRIGRVYDRAESRAAGVKIKPTQATAFLDEQIARFGEAPQGESIAEQLTKVRDSIAGGVSASGMRDARTILGQGVYDGKLRSGLEKGIYKQFLGLLSKDIEAGLSSAGRRDALNLFKIADKAWADRISYVDDVLEPVIGKAKSGEDVLTAIENMARGKSGGVRRITELLRELPPEHSGNIRATVIDRMGKATAGNQNAAGDAFSANTFLTNWNKMSGKGKSALFGSSELRQNLDKLALVAEATAETGRFANFSNTGGALNNNVIALGGVAGVSEMATGYGLATFGTLASAQLLTGKLLASPRFVAWLARVPRNPQAMKRHEGQLAQIAAREPIIANDIASIQQFLSSASQRAAAGSENQREDRR